MTLPLWTAAAGATRSCRELARLLSRESRFLIPRLPELSSVVRFDKIPSPGVTHSLEQAALERAEEVYTEKTAVLWSGGADSTLALAGFAASNLLPKLAVTPSTFQHADPRLLADLESRGFELIDGTTEGLRAWLQSGGQFITGTHGDNLVLSDAVGLAGGMQSTLATDVWGMEPAELMEVVTGRPGGEAMWRHYRWLFDQMPEHIPRDAPNCLWWIGFCFYWHRDSMYMTVYSDYGRPAETHHHFFSSVPFQRWMMQPVADRAGRTVETHKRRVIDAANSLLRGCYKIPQKTAGWDEVVGTKSFADVIEIDANFTIRRGKSLCQP